MSEGRLRDYLDHMRQAARDACQFVEGMSKEEFLRDKRTQQAVVMSLIIIGEAATKAMDTNPGFAQAQPQPVQTAPDLPEIRRPTDHDRLIETAFSETFNRAFKRSDRP